MKDIATYAVEWEKNASIDPWFAILTDMTKKGLKWDEQEFFSTGAIEIEALFQYIDKSTNIKLQESDKCLDFGCGLGRLSRALKSHFKQVVGVDISSVMIEGAKRLTPGIDFICNQANHLAVLQKESFDFIYSNIVLQHMNNRLQRGYIFEFAQLLKSGGIAAFQLPSKQINLSLKDWSKYLLKKMIPQKIRRPILIYLGWRSDEMNIEMNTLSENEVIEFAKSCHLVLKHRVYTNATEPNFNGKIKFFDENQVKEYVKSTGCMMSPLYFFQKK